MKFLPLMILGLFAATVLLFTGGCDKHAQDRVAIRHTVKRLVDSANSGDGDAYAEMIATENLEYYDRTLKMALSAKKADLMALPFHQRYEILLVRALGTRKELKGLDAKGYIAWTVKNRFMEYMPGPGESLDLGRLTFRKDEAYCELVLNTDGDTVLMRRRGNTSVVKDRAPTPYTLRFVLENGQWKFDKSTFNQAFDIEIQSELQHMGVSEDKALPMIVALVSGAEVTENIWLSMPH